MGTEATLRPARSKIIIVGAGVSGLLLANIFKKLSVDYLVLEAREDVGERVGSSYGLWPNAARILDQIDCWDAVQKACDPIISYHVRQPDGKLLMSSGIASYMTEHFGYEFRVLPRFELIRVLREKLGRNPAILTEKRVTNILNSDDGVTVCLENNECHYGTLVIGCDGAHSAVRRIMWDHANAQVPRLITTKEKRSLTSCYHALVGLAPHLPGLPNNEINTVQGEGFTMLVVGQEKQTMFFVCLKQRFATSWPQRQRFTQEETERIAESLASVSINDYLLFGEIWGKKEYGYLCSVEEGVFSHWHFGRMVLVGDAAHKMSPVGAHGGNCAIESAAALANSIYTEALPTGCKDLDNHVLEHAFHRYQESRLSRAHLFHNTAHFLTRIGSRDGLWKSLLAQYVLPRLDISKPLCALIENAERVDFFPEPERAKGFKRLATHGSMTELSQEPADIAKTLGKNLTLVKQLVCNKLACFITAIQKVKRWRLGGSA